MLTSHLPYLSRDRTERRKHLPTWRMEYLPQWINAQRQVAYAPRMLADAIATLACGAQHTPLDRRWGKRTARGILPH